MLRVGRQAKSLQCKNCDYKDSHGKNIARNQNDPSRRQAQAGEGSSGKAGQPAAPLRQARRPIIMAICTTPCSPRPSGCWNATGWSGLTLRAVAREAGVSHAAPTHHFGDLTGLLSELAAIGFRRFNEAMVAARNSETHPLMKGMAHAKAYVAYAQAHPGMFSLMFRTERLDMTRPSLHEAATASFEGLASAVGAGRNEKLTGEALEALSLDQAAAIARAWSLVHGFTTLLLDGRLQDILHRLPEGTGVDQLLDAMLRSTVARPPAGA